MGTQPKANPRFVVIEGKDKGKVFSIQDGTAVIGRSKGDWIVEDPRISRSHTAVHYDSSKDLLSFTDLKSLNGTFINGEAKESGVLKDGDKIQLGNTLFDCQLGSGDHTVLGDAKPIVIEKGLENSRSEAAPLAEEPKLEARKKSLFLALYRKTPPLVQHTAIAVLVIWALVNFYTSRTGGSAKKFETESSRITKLQSEGKLNDAIEAAIQLKEKIPQDSRVFVMLGDLYAAQGKAQLSITAYQKAHGLLPEFPLLHIKLVRAYIQAKVQGEAATEMDHVDQLIREGKHSKDLFIETAKLLLEFRSLNHSTEKAFILAKALQKEYAPENTIGFKLEAQLHMQEARHQEAVVALERAKQMDPQDVWVLENLVFAKLAMKDFGGAESSLEDWITTFPRDTKALLVMGYLKLNEKNYAKAIPYIEKIFQIASTVPNDAHYPEALSVMGQINQQLGQTSEATNYFRQSCTAGFKQGCENPLLKSASAQVEPPPSNGVTKTPIVETPPSSRPSSPQENRLPGSNPIREPPKAIPSMPRPVPSGTGEEVPAPADD